MIAFREKLTDWRALLTRHVPQARKMLQTLLLERLVFTPKEDEAGRYYEFTARGSLEPLLGGIARAKVCVSPTGTAQRAVGPFEVAFEALALVP